MRRTAFLAACAVLPCFFLYLFAILFKLPVWEVALPISALVAGLGITLAAAVLVKRYFTLRVGTQPDKARKYLLKLAVITGFGFPLVLFTLAGMIYMVRSRMPVSKVFEMGWVSFVAGAAWGWPLWIFSVPWAFVMVYGIAKGHGSESLSAGSRFD